MSRYSISQLKAKDANLSIIDTDLQVASLGTNTNEISSYKVSYKQGADYATKTYPVINGFTVASGVSAMLGLSARSDAVGNTIMLDNLPTTSSGLKTGDLFTQTAAQLDTTGGTTSTTKVLCVK